MEVNTLQHVERVLVLVVQARRALQLYPRTNHLVAESQASLHAGLQSALAAAARDEPGGKFTCEIRRDGFFAGEQQLAPDRVAVGRFARLLYLNGAKLFGFSTSARPQDADAFVEASLVLENSQAKPDWTALEFEHFGVERLAEAAVTVGESTADADLVAYMTARRDGDAEPGTTGGGGGTGATVNRELSELVKFFASVHQGREEEKQCLINTLMDPTRTAEAFTYIANAAAPPGARELSGEALRQALKHIKNTLETLPEETRNFIVNNMSEAILSTDDNTRECIVRDVLSEGIGDDELREEITKRLPPKLGASVLMHHVNLHDGTASMVSSFVDSMPNDLHKKQVKALLEAGDPDSLQDPNPITPAERMRLTQTTGGANVPVHEESHEEALERVGKLLESGQQAMRVSRDELKELQRRVETHDDLVDREQDTFTLFLLFATGQMDIKDARLLEDLQSTLHDALQLERYDLLNRVIEFALGTLRDDVRADTFRVLSHYLTPLYQEKQFENYIRTLAEGKRQNAEGPESVLLESVARGAAPVLLQELESEQVKRRRFALLSLLIAMGPVIAPKLRESLDSPHWYVARNAVYLLGKLRDLESLEGMARTLRHEDARVRLEALGALEELAVAEADPLIKTALKDADPKVRGHAAAALARRGDSSHFDAFVSELRGHPWRMLRRPDYAIGVVGAIGTLGDESSAAVVRSFSRWCWLPGRRRKDMRSACERALQDIARRSSAGATAGLR